MPEPKSLDSLKVPSQGREAFLEKLGDERLFSREQAAAFLGVSPRTIDAWCANIRARKNRRRSMGPGRPSRDRLPYIKLGHKVFFQLGDLRAFRDERKVAA
jgi:hypothetical protein